MSSTMKQKIQQLKKRFAHCQTPEQRYATLIALGRELPPLPPEAMVDDNRVEGCQSTVYLLAKVVEGKLFFSASADALISAGLANLLLSVYSGETPETILKTQPTFLDALGIPSALSPNRTNGLFSMHLRMKKEALQAAVASSKG